MRTRRKSWAEINRQRQAQIMANPFPVDQCLDCELGTECGPDCDQNKFDEMLDK